MVGKKQTRESKLFYSFDLESRVPADHPLRQLAAALDFGFVRDAVACRYGRRGNPSIDPIVLLKLIFICFFENVHSERELLRQLPLRLDWLWFCGFDIDDAVPHHSVLSKARRRWGRDLFVKLFKRVLDQCVQAGLVDGRQVYVDASVNQADASMDSLQVDLRLRGQALFDTLDAQAPLQEDQAPLQEDQAPSQKETQALSQEETQSPSQEANDDDPRDPRDSDDPAGPALALANETSGDKTACFSGSKVKSQAKTPRAKRISRTDPEARLTHKHGKHILGYKDHRVVDDRRGVITATVTTHAAVDDAKMIGAVLEQHEQQTGEHVRVAVADKAYGHANVYQELRQRGTMPCIPHKAVREDPTKFPRKLFVYDSGADCFTCPAGQTLTHRGQRYRADKSVCAACPLRAQCTDNKVHGRQLRRHPLQDEIDRADPQWSRRHRRRLMARRKIIVEGSFADAANHHGYKRHRWRGLINATIQNLLIATAQNVRKLIRYARPRPTAASATARVFVLTRVTARVFMLTSVIQRLISGLLRLPGPWSQPRAAHCHLATIAPSSRLLSS